MLEIGNVHAFTSKVKYFTVEEILYSLDINSSKFDEGLVVQNWRTHDVVIAEMIYMLK